MASMHCPKVLARTATPVSIMATWVTPGMARTAALFLILRGEPLRVGGRHTMVGSAPGTSRSIANFFLPVTMARPSTRLVGVPMTLNAAVSLSSTSTSLVVGLAALVASSPYVTEEPSGALITPSFDLSRVTIEPSWIAAASSSAPLAMAAATRIGVYVETVVLEPPVSWLRRSSGRALARVTRTLLTGRSSSSAMIIAVEVVMPCPTSMRGRAKLAVPSSLILTVIRLAVTRAASVWRSSRS